MKRLFLENWQIIRHKKNTHKMITEQQKIAWNPYFYSAKVTLAQTVTFNLAQLVRFKSPKLGPANNFTACIYIYTYIYMCVCACACVTFVCARKCCIALSLYGRITHLICACLKQLLLNVSRLLACLQIYLMMSLCKEDLQRCHMILTLMGLKSIEDRLFTAFIIQL